MSPQPPNSQPLRPRRNWKLIALFVGALGAALFALYLARGALFPFIISIVLAQLLYPVIAAVETRLPGHARHPGAARIVAIATIYLGFLAAVGVFLYLSVPPLFEESREFLTALPSLYEQARSSLESFSEDLTNRFPADLRAELMDTVESGGGVFSAAARGVFRRTISGVSNAVTLVIGLIIVPFFLFYLLKDREKVVSDMLSMLSPEAREQTTDVMRLLNEVIGAYVRATLLGASIVALFVFIGLTLLGIPFAAILAVTAGMFALIPIIGAVLGAVPGILVTLASDPDKAIWVALVYIVTQLIESNVIAPRLQGRAVRLNPAVVMIVIVVASEVAGLWGIIVGVPLTAAARDVFKYFHQRWSREESAASGEIDNARNDAADDESAARRQLAPNPNTEESP